MSASVSAEEGNPKLQYMGIYLVKNNNQIISGTRVKDSMIGLSTSCIEELNAGDFVQVYNGGTVPVLTYGIDRFNGHLIKQL